MKPGVLVIIITIFSMAFVSRAIGTVGDVRVQLAALEASRAEKGPTKLTPPDAPLKKMDDEHKTDTHDSDHADHDDATPDVIPQKMASKDGDVKGHDANSDHSDMHMNSIAGKGATPPTHVVEKLAIPPREQPKDHFDLARIVRERTAEIERRISELNKREQTLNAVEMRINEKLAELEAARASLATTAERLDAASSEDIKVLASMYANMKPAQAGQIFNAMEPTFAAGFLTQIRSESAAAILASMEPQKAYAVSVIIAGRNVDN
ncbi:MAG: hypothetical protein AAF720_04460 [Pseudomonadota bacterium]